MRKWNYPVDPYPEVLLQLLLESDWDERVAMPSSSSSSSSSHPGCRPRPRAVKQPEQDALAVGVQVDSHILKPEKFERDILSTG